MRSVVRVKSRRVKTTRGVDAARRVVRQMRVFVTEAYAVLAVAVDVIGRDDAPRVVVFVFERRRVVRVRVRVGRKLSERATAAFAALGDSARDSVRVAAVPPPPPPAVRVPAEFLEVEPADARRAVVARVAVLGDVAGPVRDFKRGGRTRGVSSFATTRPRSILFLHSILLA
jgi:DNA-binding IclR family transcriptional regulator